MTDEDIRRIVREEIRDALEALESAADHFSGYDTDTVEDMAASVVGRVCSGARGRLLHTKECPERAGGWSVQCSCGGEEW